MAKAYNTISLDILERVLKRIKILYKFLNLILELFKSRRFSIITSLELTNQNTAEDGIDQGETISLLLW